MRNSGAVLIALGLGLALNGCSPPPQAPPPPKPAAATVAQPAKVGTMICRSSIDGRPAKCGTPNAVMVGMKFE